MDIEHANDHPFKVAVVGNDNGMYANSHPYKVSIVEGGSTFVTELPETGTPGTMYVLVDNVENPTKAYGIYTYNNGWVLVSQPVDQAVKKVDELPEVGEEGILYYLAKEGDDTYDLYRWIDNTWIKVDTDIQLYNSEGDNTDGAMTQAATTALKGKAKELTSVDYNYPTDNPTSIAIWLLEPGLYRIASGVSTRLSRTWEHTSTGDFWLIADKGVRAIWWTGSSAGYVRVVLRADGSNVATYANIDTANLRNDLVYPTAGQWALDAAQGKVLNDKIGGDLSNLTTEDKTSLINAINEVAGKGGVTELTSADYNYPTGSPSSVALWLLESGLYSWTNLLVRANSSTACRQTGSALVEQANDRAVILTQTESTSKYISVTKVSDGSMTITSGDILTAGSVAQSTGTSTTDVMSQNATTKMVFADPSTQQKIRIGNTSTIGNYATSIGARAIAMGNGSVSIGFNAQTSGISSVAVGDGIANGRGSIALGSGSVANTQGEMNIGTSSGSEGYNNSAYRLLTGLYDPQSDHDAATKGYVDTAIADISEPTEFSTAEWDSLWT